MTTVVSITKSAERELRRLPIHVVRKLMGWVAIVEAFGVEEARRVPGYHDEPLKGQRAGQRSIRLSRSYRAIYVTSTETGQDGPVTVVSVEEVNRHDY